MTEVLCSPNDSRSWFVDSPKVAVKQGITNSYISKRLQYLTTNVLNLKSTNVVG